MILLENNETKLFVLGGGTKQTITSAARKLYGDRIMADIKDGKTYILTLKNLHFSDENSFRLEVWILAAGRGDTFATMSFRKATIQLAVRGMFLVIITKILFVKIWKQYFNKF